MSRRCDGFGGMPVVGPCSHSLSVVAGSQCPLPGVSARPADVTPRRTDFQFLLVGFSDRTSPGPPGPDQGEAGCVRTTLFQLGVLVPPREAAWSLSHES